MTSSLLVLVGADIIRPSLAWLFTGGKKRKLARNMICSRDPGGFARLRQLCRDDPAITPAAQAKVLFRCAVIIAAKGGVLAEVTIGDVLEAAGRRARGPRPAGLGRGDIPGAAGDGRVRAGRAHLARDPRHRAAHGRGTGRPLPDRLPPGPRPDRRLPEGTPARDRLRDLAEPLLPASPVLLGGPGAPSPRHRLAAASARCRRRVEAAAADQDHDGHHRNGRDDAGHRRAAQLPGHPRQRPGLLSRPGRMGAGRPGPVGSVGGPVPDPARRLQRRKFIRRRKARMDARTRERLPVLPVLVRTAAQWRDDAQALLAAARQAEPGQEFTAAGQTLIRSIRPHSDPRNVWASDPAAGNQRLLNREEEHAFWAWAVIEVLRLTGVRVEELLELTHHSLVKYRLPDTGELVPLLQIAPSKTDAERLLVVSPELADVLSAVICRVRGRDGAIPLVRGRDCHELVWLPPSPLLFQRRTRTENHKFTGPFVADLLDDALARTGLTDSAAGGPLRFTPHDFRRMFITDAIMNGLPPHIAQVIAGHQDLNVTMGYKAVYPDEAFRAHLAFLARRRALRPSEEYRVPTDEEWQDFFGHFQRRKVSVGTCGRAFGTPCIHEHACIRCPMLWPDPAQRDRLAEIRDNLIARIAEAEHKGWLGEVEGLQVSLGGAREKLAQIDRSRRGPATVDLGIPAFPQPRTPPEQPGTSGP